MAYWGDRQTNKLTFHILTNKFEDSFLKHKMLGPYTTNCYTDQFQHPWATTACGEATKQAKNNNDGSGSDEDIWCVSALFRSQGEIGLQAHLPPHSNGQEDHPCELGESRASQLHSLRFKKSPEV